jgi:hypothetical protein
MTAVFSNKEGTETNHNSFGLIDITRTINLSLDPHHSNFIIIMSDNSNNDSLLTLAELISELTSFYVSKQAMSNEDALLLITLRGGGRVVCDPS